MQSVDLDILKSWCTEAFEAVGTCPSDAEVVSDCLVSANTRGVDSHGIVLAPLFINRIRKKLMNPRAKASMMTDSGSYCVVDGNNGLGPVIGSDAMQKAIEKASQNGIGTALVRNTNHIGMAAYYAMKATNKEMLGVVLSNSHPVMAPWGGKESAIGSNPICLAAPSALGFPIVLDMATSALSRGKIRMAATRREKLPDGAALDKEGRVTTDPDAALQGTMLPFGGPKGYGLAIFVEVFSGILSGSAFGMGVKPPYGDDAKAGVGNLFAAINISKFVQPVEFKTRLGRFCNEMKETPKAEGFEEIILPGEIEYRQEQMRRKSGIPLDERTLDQLHSLSEGLRISEPAMR